MNVSQDQANDGSSSVRFKSYVIYDLETTTLPSFGTARITEISAISVLRDHIENLTRGEGCPRVLNKLTLCVYPIKMVSFEAERLTGLSNELLEDLNPFNEEIFTTLENFFNHIPQPVCLIAHNGNRFDFPILQYEVQKIGKKFADRLWCADSLPAFRYIYVDQPKESFIESQKTEKSQTVPSSSDMESMLDEPDGFDLMLCDVVDSVEKGLSSPKMEVPVDKDAVMTTPTKQNPWSPCQDGNGMDFMTTPSKLIGTLNASEMQKINETTPKRPFGHFVPKVPKLAVNRDHDYYTPATATMNEESKRVPKKLPVKRLVTEFNKCHTARPNSFKLADIYRYVCGKEPVNSHSAEADAFMLLKSIIGCRESFLNWVDKNAVPFNSVKTFQL